MIIFMKRLFDIVFSLVALIVFFIPMSLISLLIIFREKHPLFFKQERIGKDKKVFKIFKFQSMADQKITKTGRIIRKTGLDELPQFINVLKGDMSIVGPRALTLFDIERLNWNTDYHTIRWTTKPGITGLAQIYGGQHRLISWFWDVHYIDNHHVVKDFIIVVISFLMNIFGKTPIRRIVFSNQYLK